MLKVVREASESSDGAAAVGAELLDALVRVGARQMLATALQAEVAAYIDAHADQLDADGHRLVLRNGSYAPREVMTAAGAVRSGSRPGSRTPDMVSWIMKGWGSNSQDLWIGVSRDLLIAS
jgi:hypothetical protein